MFCSIFVHFLTTSHYTPRSSTRKNPKILTLLTFFIVFIYYYYFTNIEILDQIPPLSFNLLACESGMELPPNSSCNTPPEFGADPLRYSMKGFISPPLHYLFN